VKTARILVGSGSEIDSLMVDLTRLLVEKLPGLERVEVQLDRKLYKPRSVTMARGIPKEAKLG
jgi:hypothetical protein